MVFSSIIFVFAFLPITLAVYHGLRALLVNRAPTLWQHLRLVVLLAFSLVFYAWGELRWIGILLTSAGVDFVAGFLLARGWQGPPAPLDPAAREPWQRAVLACALFVNVGLLFLFKYAPFVHVALPLGISFYTFKSMSYSIDVFRGHVVATRDPLRYACFVTLFPEMVAGPIVRYSSVAAQLAHDALTLDGAAYGVRRFVTGLAKKVLIANTLAVPVDTLWALPPAQLPAATAWFAILAYALQIYFDFSGYSDMAIGLGHLFGFRFPENFAHPYAGRSLKDFWRRWHISLSTWFRDYLYIPLGGDRRGPARTMFNLTLVFFLCGLWHGAATTFVVWGLWHGAFLVLERTSFGALLSRAPALVQHAYTLLVVVLGWVPFRAHGLPHAARFLAAMCGANVASSHPLVWYVTPPVAVAFAAGVVFSAPWPRPTLPAPLTATLRLTAIAALLAASLVTLAAGTHNPFIYYRF